MRLRAATAADLDAVWGIESSVFGAEAWSRGMMLDELTADHRAYRVLETADGSVVGYAGLLAVGSEGDIQTIAVAPEARGEGLGRLLMEALLTEAGSRGVREVFLEVRADNPVAQSLYESLGFEGIAVRPRYYQPDDVDAIVMRLELQEER
ncbi:ribosomal-protein-alanine N-acetyltransferase [Leucobacter zeae]|nr:ribosomal-protein-alanine N-acetyltransferase [Leucobacter zeae]